MIVENQFITCRWQSRLLAYWWPQRDYYTNVCSSVIGHTFHLPGWYQSLITEPHCARNLTFRYEENPKKMQNVKNWFWVSFTLVCWHARALENCSYISSVLCQLSRNKYYVQAHVVLLLELCTEVLQLPLPLFRTSEASKKFIVLISQRSLYFWLGLTSSKKSNTLESTSYKASQRRILKNSE